MNYALICILVSQATSVEGLARSLQTDYVLKVKFFLVFFFFSV